MQANLSKKKGESKKKFDFKFLENINPLTVIFFIILFIVALTYIVPGGAFVREEVEVMGSIREIIVPGSFQYVDSIPQGFSKIWTIFMEGAIEGADISFTIFICSGAITAILATGAVNAGINSIVNKFKGNIYLLIIILTFAFGLGGATYGMYEDAMPFVLVLAPLMLAMKLDSLVAVMIVQFGVAIGSASGFLNPFAVGIGQAMAGVPMTSGIGVRVIIWLFLMALVCIFIVRYAKKVSKDPNNSVVLEDDIINRKKYEEGEIVHHSGLSKRDGLVLISLAIGFGIMIYGVMKLEWWFNEIGSVFLFMGIIIPLIGGLSVNEMIDKNIEGMGSVISAVLIISCSRIVVLLLQNSMIMDTILYAISNLLINVPKAITAQITFVVTSIMHILMGSSSGVAATLMPIMAPLSDVLEIPRQVIVLAYQLGTGALGHFMPWDGISFAMCALAGINFFKYIKEAAKFAFYYYIPAVIVILTLAVTFNFS